MPLGSLQALKGNNNKLATGEMSWNKILTDQVNRLREFAMENSETGKSDKYHIKSDKYHNIAFTKKNMFVSLFLIMMSLILQDSKAVCQKKCLLSLL